MCNNILLLCLHFWSVILTSLGRDIVINHFPWHRCISARSLQLISTQLSYLHKTLGTLKYNWLIDLRTCLMATSAENFTLLSVLENFILRRWKYARCLHLIRRDRACRACRFLEYIYTMCVANEWDDFPITHCYQRFDYISSNVWGQQRTTKWRFCNEDNPKFHSR